MEVIGKCTPIKVPIEFEENADAGNTSSLSTEKFGHAVNLIADSYPQYSIDDLADSVSTIDAKTPGSTASTSLTTESPLMTQPDDDSIVIPNHTKRARVKEQKFMFEKDDC
ncbi:hypothetical protein PIB30_016436 [Stylosanthes scabra]|uniref:Uncharacterized protein n=1 Tax=Stylosanthes scabra TaxID=79078 RepID=A0ABU6WAT9_9FABA|nr:hypothetical protein [Stylosanthes scabra]